MITAHDHAGFRLIDAIEKRLAPGEACAPCEDKATPTTSNAAGCSVAVKPGSALGTSLLVLLALMTTRRRAALAMSVAALLGLAACGGSAANRELGVPPETLREQLAICESDTGACPVNIECSATPEVRICDASEYIAADEAVRIARANGLAEGLDALKPSLLYDHSVRRMTWLVQNLVYDDRADGSRGGDIYVVDAVTGELIGKQLWGAVR